MSNQLPSYIIQACLRPLGGIQSRIMLRRSQAKAILRRRRCRTISGSSGRPFCVPFYLHGSRDLEENDQISIVAIWHCSDVLLSF
jgi:hypothetical protein